MLLNRNENDVSAATAPHSIQSDHRGSVGFSLSQCQASRKIAISEPDAMKIEKVPRNSTDPLAILIVQSIARSSIAAVSVARSVVGKPTLGTRMKVRFRW